MKKTLTILSVCLAAAHPLSAEETLEVGTQSPDSQALGAEITETVETDVPPAFPSSETENLSDTVITETDDGITETDDGITETDVIKTEELPADDGLVWDSEEPLDDAAAAKADIPIRLRAEKAAESELEYLTQTLKLDSKQNELLRQVLTDLAVKQLRIDENSDLKAARKSVMRTGLKLEKKSRLKAVFTKEQYKQYRRLDK